MSVTGSSFTPKVADLLCSRPAQWVDHMYANNPSVYRIKGIKGIKDLPDAVGARLISGIVFPIFATIDLVWVGAYGSYTFVRGHIIADAKESQHLRETAAECHELAMKCLRGIASSPISFIYANIVTAHYVPEPEADGKVHPYGKLYSSKVKVETPETIKDVQELVSAQLEQGAHIGIRGAGFSQGKQTLPSDKAKDIVLDMRNFNTVEINPKTKIAKVGSGATWKDLQNAANTLGLAVDVQQASNPFSIGGSLSVNCHGWSKAGTLAETVQSVTIVNAKGDVQKLAPEDDDFGFVLSGMGGFGVMIEAELRLVENLAYHSWGEEVAIDNYVDHFYKHILNNSAIHLHLYRLSLTPGRLLQEGYVQNYSPISSKGEPTENLYDEGKYGSLLDRILIQVARVSATARKLWWAKESQNIQDACKITRNELMRPPINAALANHTRSTSEWLQEYFVPPKKLAAFVKFLGKKLDENEVVLMNGTVRYVKQDHLTHMGYANRGDRFAVVIFFNQHLLPEERKKTKAWVREVADWLGENEGSFYLPYMQYPTKEQFQKNYPQYKTVIAKKEELDPQHVFWNGLYEKYLNSAGALA